MSGNWQDRVPEELIEALGEDEDLVSFTDEWRELTADEQLTFARSWLRQALALEVWR